MGNARSVENNEHSALFEKFIAESCDLGMYASAPVTHLVGAYAGHLKANGIDDLELARRTCLALASRYAQEHNMTLVLTPGWLTHPCPVTDTRVVIGIGIK